MVYSSIHNVLNDAPSARSIPQHTRLRIQVRSGGSYLPQNDLRLHFGLGSSTNADSIELRSPSGETDRYFDIKADHFYVVTEGLLQLRSSSESKLPTSRFTFSLPCRP